MGIARGWEKRVIRTNETYAKRTVRIFSVSPQTFLHRPDNNHGQPLHETWRTLCMNKHLINTRILPNPVGRTHKTSFPLSSNSKASLCSDFKTNPNSCGSKSRRSTSVSLQRKYSEFITVPTEYREWLVENITWQLASKFTQWVQWELPVAGRSR